MLELLQQSPKKPPSSASRNFWDAILSPGLGRPSAQPVYLDQLVGSPSFSFLDSSSPASFRHLSPATRAAPSPVQGS